MMAASFKWPKIARFYMLYHVLTKMLESTRPLEFEHASFNVSNTLLYYGLCHSEPNWIRDAVVTLIYVLVHPTI